MRAVFSPDQKLHDPQFFLVQGKPQSSAEQPERTERLLAALDRIGIATETPADYGLAPLAAIHSVEYLEFLASAHQRWQELPNPSEEVIANIHPQRYHASYPKGIIGQAGWHMADTACPIGRHTWDAARHSANTALAATDIVLGGAQSAYALCRPPGHHAYTDMAGGFCFLNNAAVAAQHCLRDAKRVAILDVDVHHGNGTQGIFYQRADVYTLSLHADPNHFYPFHWGHEHERGIGPGEGYNRNYALARNTGDAPYMEALDAALQSIAVYAPDVLIVALGLDASEHDPLQGLSITTPGFEQMGGRIAAAGMPTVYVQEGGYLSDALTDNLEAFLRGVNQ
jgi:acetoin utilization deacetylase AcuC-like enzyme